MTSVSHNRWARVLTAGAVVVATAVAGPEGLPDEGFLRVANAGCSVADFGAVADNKTDNSVAFRRAAKACAGAVMLVPAGTWMTGPFNLSSHTVLRVEGTISGSQNPDAYPVSQP